MKYLDKVLTVVFLCLLCIVFYHLSVLLVRNSEIMKSVYHISHNTIILSLLYLVYKEIEDVNKYFLHRRVIKWLSVYPAYKIILNILYMFSGFRVWVENMNTHVWSFMLTSLILFIFVRIKYIRR